MLILLKLEHALITADLLDQNPTKNVTLLCEKLFWLGVANGYLSRVLNTVITDEIAMIKITEAGRFPLSLSLNDNKSTL